MNYKFEDHTETAVHTEGPLDSVRHLIPAGSEETNSKGGVVRFELNGGGYIIATPVAAVAAVRPPPQPKSKKATVKK